MAKFAEQCVDGYGFLTIDIGGADFGLGGRSHDVGHDFGHNVNVGIEPRASSGVIFWIGRAVTEKIMATGVDLGTGHRKV